MSEPVTALFVRADDEAEDAPLNATERLLLLLAGGFLTVNFMGLLVLRGGGVPELAGLLVWLVCALIGHLVLRRGLPRRDPLFFPLVMLLVGWGLILIERLAPAFADRQTVWLAVSFTGMLAAAVLPQPLRWLREYRYTLLTVGLLLLVSTILLGRNPTGLAGAPQLWLGLGDVYFQPSEALKVILVAFLASYLAEQYPVLRAEGLGSGGRQPGLSARVVGPLLLMWSLSVVVLIWQRDLGTAVLFFLIFMILLYITSGNALILLSGALLTLAAALAGYFLFSVVRLRFDIWWNPWLEPDGRAYQIVQSLMAFASGGVFGQGVGQGRPVYIPVAHSDFVFAALAEEWGLLGVVAVVVVIGTLVARGLRASLLQQDRPFYALLGVGLTALLGVQSLMIMGGVLKIVPLTGVTLPFMSYGGSSLLMSFIMVGLLLRLSSGEA